jgi:nucleoside-diphosphate-sugar epimerase
MTILITGSTGFVGKNLTRFFQERDINYLELTRTELLKGDFNKVHKAEVVVHLAGKAHDLKAASDSNDYTKINYELTKNLYQAFLQSSSSKFIFISSVKAAADYSNGSLSEDCIPNPKTSYGQSKLMAEKYIEDQHLPVGKSYYILRPCMIHGAGNKGNLNLLYQFIKHGIPYPLAAFENKRSFLSVENLCFVIRELILQENVVSGVYNVSDDSAISTNELVSLISQELGIKPRFWQVNTRLVKLLASLGDVLKLPLNTEKLTKLTENYVVDNRKIRNALRKELPISAAEGITKTIKSFKTLK